MTELEQICENALYDVIRVLEDGKSIVRDIPTGRLYFKKTLDVYNIQVFAYLRDHRSHYVPSIQAFWKEGDQLVVIEELIQGRTLEELLEDATAITALACDQATATAGPGCDQATATAGPGCDQATATAGPGCDRTTATTGPACDRASLDFAERISILTQICDGLEFLHSAEPPIIHRDIKASNIMVTDDGIVKIIDYDAAKIFRTGRKKDTVMIGTQGLAAPEQYGFAQSDVRTDLYALGKLIERMLPDNADAKRIADKATQMDPKKRYTSAAQMKQQILRIREKPSLIDRELEKISGVDIMNPEQRKRARAAIAAGALAVVLLTAFLGWRFLIYPTRLTEEINTELASIAGGQVSTGGTSTGGASPNGTSTSGTSTSGTSTSEPGALANGATGKNSTTVPEIPASEIPPAVRNFTTQRPYQKMNAAQKKSVRDSMESAIARCLAAGNVEDAQEVRDILADQYGDEALWEAVYNYGEADYALAVGEFEQGLAALRKCMDEDSPDAADHWEKGVTLTRESLQNNMELFRDSPEIESLQAIVNAAKALETYAPESAEDPEQINREILAIAAAKSEAQDFDTAIAIYETMADAETGEEQEQSDLNDLIAQTRYAQAQAAMDEKSYKDAALLFGNLGDYGDAADKYRECLYHQGIAEQENGNYELAAAVFEEISGYKDADELCLRSKYSYCEQTASDPTETTYAFFEALVDSGYDGAEELREQIYKWHVKFETGMSYSFGPMQSAYVKATLSGGPPDASTTITFRIDDPTRGEHDTWTDENRYRSGDTVEISYSEEDSTYSLFDREYKVSVFADGDELIGDWEGRFGM